MDFESISSKKGKGAGSGVNSNDEKDVGELVRKNSHDSITSFGVTSREGTRKYKAKFKKARMTRLAFSLLHTSSYTYLSLSLPFSRSKIFRVFSGGEATKSVLSLPFENVGFVE